MPLIRLFEVTQVRTVRVTANDLISAAAIATSAFEHGQDSDNGVMQDKAPVGVWGNTVSQIKEVSLSVDAEDRWDTP